ncbi:MAG: hypothetical protein ACFFG0_01985 [Candidatus Thorarchaeota archaeon]
MKILNIAAGKIKPLEIPNETPFQKRYPKRIINVDTTYYQYTSPSKIEIEIETMLRLDQTKEWYCNEDAFKFMENTKTMFDRVVIYRFLEHVSFTQVNYFLYLTSTVLKEDGLLDVIIPNYRILADMLLKEKIDKNFEAHNILLTTELLNEPSCPHASIWTPDRVKYFVELEGRYKVDSIMTPYKFDGRDIYIRFLARRI